MNSGFLPVCRREMEERGWESVDFVYVSGDAYVDHPSFGHAIITRVLETITLCRINGGKRMHLARAA